MNKQIMMIYLFIQKCLSQLTSNEQIFLYPDTQFHYFLPSADSIPNPDRGFYVTSSMTYQNSSNDYNPISKTVFNNISSIGATLIKRVVYLKYFMTSGNISVAVSNLILDFKDCEANQIKVILKIAYQDNDIGSPFDDSPPIAMILSHIDQLKPAFQQYYHMIAFIEAGFFGSYGDWLETDLFASDPNNLQSLTYDDYVARKSIIDALLDALQPPAGDPITASNKQVLIPFAIQKYRMLQLAPDLAPYSVQIQAYSQEQFNRSAAERIGFYDVCIGYNGSQGFLSFENQTIFQQSRDFVQNEGQYVAVGGLACIDSDFTNQTVFLTNLHDLRFVYFDYDSADNAIPSDLVDVMSRKLGYRLVLINVSYPSGIGIESDFTVEMFIRNDGYAGVPPDYQLYLYFSNIVFASKQYTYIPINFNIQLLKPGGTLYISAHLNTSREVFPQTNCLYDLYLKLSNIHFGQNAASQFNIQFANINTWDQGQGLNILNSQMYVSDCSFPCKQCYDDGVNSCQSCDQNGTNPLFFLLNHTCIDSTIGCPTQYINLNSTCQPICDAQCESCFGILSTQCTSCQSSYPLFLKLTVDNICCNQTCKTCYSQNVCETCLQNNPINGTCLFSSCAPGSHYDPHFTGCFLCDPTCQMDQCFFGNSAFHCFACKNSTTDFLEIYGGDPDANTKPYGRCYNNTPVVCQNLFLGGANLVGVMHMDSGYLTNLCLAHCIPSWYIVNPLTNICEKECPGQLFLLTNETNLSALKCVIKCDQMVYAIDQANSTCTPLPPCAANEQMSNLSYTCEPFVFSNAASNCIAPYLLQTRDQSCVLECQASQQTDLMLNRCFDCHPSCLKCDMSASTAPNASLNCTSCQPNYIFVLLYTTTGNGQCLLTQCENQLLKPDAISQETCVTCDASCQDGQCQQGGSEFYCTACKNTSWFFKQTGLTVVNDTYTIEYGACFESVSACGGGSQQLLQNQYVGVVEVKKDAQNNTVVLNRCEFYCPDMFELDNSTLICMPVQERLPPLASNKIEELQFDVQYLVGSQNTLLVRISSSMPHRGGYFPNFASNLQIMQIEGLKSQTDYNYTVQKVLSDPLHSDDYLMAINLRQGVSIFGKSKIVIALNISSQVQVQNKVILSQIDKTFYLNSMMQFTEDQQNTLDTQKSMASALSGSISALALASAATGGSGGASSVMMLGLIELLMYQNIDYPPNVLDIFNRLTNFPPAFLATQLKFQSNDYDIATLPTNLIQQPVSPYFLNNHLEYILQNLLIICIAYAVSFATDKLQFKQSNSYNRIIKPIINYLQHVLCWNMVLMFVIEAFFERSLYTWVTVIYPPLNSAAGLFNFQVSLLFLVLNLFFILHLAMLVHTASSIEKIHPKTLNNNFAKYNQIPNSIDEQQFKQQIKNDDKQIKQTSIWQPVKSYGVRQSLIQQFFESRFWERIRKAYMPKSSAEQHSFLLKYQILHEELKDEYPIQKYNIVLEVVRIFVMTFIVIVFQNYPLVQSVLDTLIMTLHICNFIYLKPIKVKLNFYITLILEGCIFVAYLAATILAYFDMKNAKGNEDDRRIVADSMVYASFSVMYISSGMMLLPLIISLAGFLKRQFAKSNIIMKHNNDNNEQEQQHQLDQAQEQIPQQLHQQEQVQLQQAQNQETVENIYYDNFNINADDEQIGETSNLQNINLTLQPQQSMRNNQDMFNIDDIKEGNEDKDQETNNEANLN